PPSTTSCPQRESVLRSPSAWALSKSFMPQRITKGPIVLLIFLSFLCLFVANFPASAQFAKNDITYSTTVITPHVPWATKLPQGPIRSFFIPSIQYGRDMVELMQRIALDPTT